MYFKQLLKLGVAAGFGLPVLGLVAGIAPEISSDSFFDQQGAVISSFLPDTGKKDSLQLPYP